MSRHRTSATTTIVLRGADGAQLAVTADTTATPDLYVHLERNIRSGRLTGGWAVTHGGTGRGAGQVAYRRREDAHRLAARLGEAWADWTGLPADISAWPAGAADRVRACLRAEYVEHCGEVTHLSGDLGPDVGAQAPEVLPRPHEVRYGLRVWTLGEDGETVFAEGHGRRTLAAICGHRRGYSHLGRPGQPERIEQRWVLIHTVCGCSAADHDAAHTHADGDSNGAGCWDRCEHYGLPPCVPPGHAAAIRWTSSWVPPGTAGAAAVTIATWGA